MSLICSMLKLSTVTEVKEFFSKLNYGYLNSNNTLLTKKRWNKFSLNGLEKFVQKTYNSLEVLYSCLLEYFSSIIKWFLSNQSVLKLSLLFYFLNYFRLSGISEYFIYILILLRTQKFLVSLLLYSYSISKFFFRQ